MRFAFVFGLLLFAGCISPKGDPTPLPNQDQAIRIVWNQVYGQTKPVPEVYWRRDQCNEPNGIYGAWACCTFTDSNGDRVAGLEIDDASWVEIGAPSRGFAFSGTVLAHELLHAVIGDIEHVSPDWQTLRPDADDALRAAGL